jgi:uncharacterized membrane protein
MEFTDSMDATTWMVVLAASVIITLVLFSKAIKFILKLAVIAVMLAVIAYFLQQAGIIQIPGLGNQGS